MQMDTGCVSFLSMLNAADAFIKAGLYRNIAIVTVTNFVSRLSDFQKSKKSFVLGDGASATLVEPGEASVISFVEESRGENYGLMLCRPKNVEGEPERFYFEPGAGPLDVEFSLSMLEQLKQNAVSLVTSSVHRVLEKANVTKNDVNWLLTHQPNIGLIERWRESIGISQPRVFDTFHLYGNLFQSSLPVTMSEAIDQQLFKKGDLIAMGTFANGGDYVGATLIRW
jgi:3-oxoacyl-[acyl-carrier-protein] synthase III